MAKIQASYTKTIGPDGVKFKIIPSSSLQEGFSFARLFLCCIPAGLIASFVSTAAIGVVMFFGINVLVYIAGLTGPVVFVYCQYKFYHLFSGWLLRTETKTRHAYDVELLVNSSGINILNTKTFIPSGDIHRLMLKNTVDTSFEIPLTGTVAVGSPVLVGAAVASTAINNGIAALANAKRRQAASIGYLVTVEAGGVAHNIAGGLTEVCANGVMHDIGRALNNEIG